MPLAALETIETLHVRPLPLPSLLSHANRLLRFDFPPSRDFEVCCRTVQKGIIQPQLSTQHLNGLPAHTVERLSQVVFQVSVDAHCPDAAGKSDTADAWLSLIISAEELLQYDLTALVSEDLALLESHAQGNLHDAFFKPGQRLERVSHLLESQGYRTDLLLADAPETMDLVYWLSRRLTNPLPWTRILACLSSASQDTANRTEDIFPYLARLARIDAFLKTQPTLYAAQRWDGTFLLHEALPQCMSWIRSEFRAFSAESHVPRPVEELVLAEGSTEELLLPAVAKVLGVNPNYEGILIQSVGGKNQMLQQYVTYLERLAVPITIVMDRDALPLQPDLDYYRRSQDRLFILEEGEMEDLYDRELIVKTVNEHYAPSRPLTLALLQEWKGRSQVKTLQTVWQELGLGLFDKIEFAQALVETMNHEKWISPPMKQLVSDILAAKANGHSVHLPG